MTAVLFNARLLTAVFQPSAPVVIDGSQLTIDFTIVVTTAATKVEYYLEFTGGDPIALTTNWYREIAEEDAGGGIVSMPKVVRAFAENGGANLAVGTHRLSAQFVRKHAFARLQARAVAGGGAALLTAVEFFGRTPVSA